MPTAFLSLIFVEFKDFFIALTAKIFEGFLWLYFHLMYFLLQVFWQMAQDILASYQVMERIDGILAMLDPQLANAAKFFKLKECVHLLASAQITRFLFSFIPFA